MALTPGTRLGPYEITAQIGVGGMGEVYRAIDTHLKRNVAIKVLPSGLAGDVERLARFQREAEVLASLNHPHIAQIHGLEKSDDLTALVMELVEGEDLSERIARGPIPLDEALPIAKQIAEALEAAHEKGIIHRDLKPANIKLRPDGTVKVLDFGLAKAMAPIASSLNMSQSPTITSPAMTQLGIILGTAAYMSPEQARGKPADKRSDIWAFGAVLYEMLTGKPAFAGDDVSDTLANILKTEPDWNVLPAGTPSTIVRALRRCLEKNPNRRTHDISDAQLDLEEKDHSVTATLVSTKPRLLTVERVAWFLLAASLSGVLAYIELRTTPPPAVVRSQIEPPEGSSFGSTSGIGRADGTSGAMLSPDGTRLAFVATGKDGRSEIWLRRFDSFTSRPLSGTDDVLMPFWSPDSRSIGFFAAGKLKRIDTTDGSIETITDAVGVPRGASWGNRDVIVFSVGTPPRLARVSAGGGEVTPIVTPNNAFARWPSFLPDGRHFLYVGRLRSGVDMIGILVGSIEPGFESRSVVASDSNAAFAAPGVLLFMRGERLMQQQFDPDRLEVSGDATPVAEDVFYNPGVGRADFTVSNSGVLAFRSSSNRGNQFAWFDRGGKLLETIGPPGNYRTPDLSPDGQRLAYGDVNQRDVWIFDLARRTSSRFTNGPGTETAPVWFPDGTKIAYRTDQRGMFEKDVTGTGAERVLLAQPVNGPDQISADGKWILYFAITPGGNQDVYVLPTAGELKPQLVVQTSFPDVEPQFSPDVRWLAYASSENGRNEIYVQAFPSTGRRWQISNSGGRQPLWRADGKELFFVSDERKFYAVDVSISANSGSFEYGVPHFLFDMRANVFNSRNSYIPSRDGKRFLVNMLLEADDAPINVVHNWRAVVK